MSLREQLIDAINSSKKTRYTIALGAKVDHAVLRRFLIGERDIRLATAERLARYLGLELKVPRPASRLTRRASKPARRKASK